MFYKDNTCTNECICDIPIGYNIAAKKSHFRLLKNQFHEYLHSEDIIFINDSLQISINSEH